MVRLSQTKINPCPNCGHVLEPVQSAKGDHLGYFCPLVVVAACDYIEVISTAEHEANQKYGKEKS